MIQRKTLIRQYNPVLSKPDPAAPMTLGNGNFAFHADVTGMQTFYDACKDTCPLLTMADFGWHSTPDEEGKTYRSEEVIPSEYVYRGRKVSYPVKRIRGGEAAYDWRRQNPHRANLMRIRLCLDERVILPSMVSDVHQELDLFTGILESHFTLDGERVQVTTAVGEGACVAFRIESALCRDRLSLLMDFPYPSPDITASDFEKKDLHTTMFTCLEGQNLVERRADDLTYYLQITSDMAVLPQRAHELFLFAGGAKVCSLVVQLGTDKENLTSRTCRKVLEESKNRFYTFWNTGAMIDVTESEDPRADLLEKRIITSLYQCYTQDLGKYPPQETGLCCNSWYGKFHLEMHPIHGAFAALYGKGALLEQSLSWYEQILPWARKNAQKNGFKGARWPKMTDPGGLDAPSKIAPLLIWQQPHLIYMLELLRQSRYREDRVEIPGESEEAFLLRYKELVEETADFMADYCAYNEEKDCYELLPPLYSVQEKGDPEKIQNPPFETAYWSFGLKKAYAWLNKLGEEKNRWLEIADKMAKPATADNRILAYEGCLDTYTRLALDHPAMVYAKAFFNTDTDEKILRDTYEAILENWDMSSLWGWDFPVLAMYLARSGQMEKAFDMLLMESEKNTYLENGFNRQGDRQDLPLYLPGNGALLLAMTMLGNCKGWQVKTEGIMPYPF